MEWHALANERLSAHEREKWGPELVPVGEWGAGEAENQVKLGAYEEAFWEYGGRVGGW